MRKLLIGGSFIILILTTFYIITFEGSFLIGGSSNLNELKIVQNNQSEQIISNTTDEELINAKEVFSAYDSAHDLYYVSNKDIIISRNFRTKLFLYYDETTKIYSLFAENGNKQRTYRFVETNLPIMNISSIIKEQNGKETRAQVAIFDTDNAFSEYMLDYSKRGASSESYEKTSYSLQNIKNLPMSMLGLPQNTKYVINSLYEDEYKVRDVLSWDIYSQFQAEATDRSIKSSPDMVYIEVFMDDEYIGLYGLQEYSNEFKLGFDDSSGSIYEVRNYIFPGDETESPISNNWDSLKLKFSNVEYPERWKSMQNFIELLNIEDSEDFTLRADELLDIDNFIDYYIFIETVTARDNIWKNMFFSQKTNESIVVTPWDLDNAFGSQWTGILPYKTETSSANFYSVFKIINDSKYPIQKLLSDHETFSKDAANRYFELRTSFLTKENLIETSDKYYNLLRDTGAFERDNERWPNGPKIAKDKENYMNEFINKRIDYLDKHFSQILVGEYD